MGQAASHCGNAQACFDVDGQGRMELCDSGGELPAVPQQHRATVPSSGHAASAPHAAARAEHADALPTGHPRASPHGGMVGRNHSVQRSFGTPAHSPCASHIGGGGGVGGVGSEADRMLEELRNMYATPTASRQGALPGDASLLAEKIVRQREMASARLRGEPNHEDVLVRSALDVVAQRFVAEGLPSARKAIESSHLRSGEKIAASCVRGSQRVQQRIDLAMARGNSGNTYSATREALDAAFGRDGAQQDDHNAGTEPQTHFSRRRAAVAAAASCDRAMPGSHSSDYASDSGSLVCGAGRASHADATVKVRDVGSAGAWSERKVRDHDQEALEVTSLHRARQAEPGYHTPRNQDEAHPRHLSNATSPRAGSVRIDLNTQRAPRRTMEEVLLFKYDTSLADLAAAGCAPPPPQLVSLRMTDAEWSKHLRRAGVDLFLQKQRGGGLTKRSEASAATPRSATETRSVTSEMDAGAWQHSGVPGANRGLASSEGSAAASGQAHSADGPVLPAGWKRYISRTSGKTFYKNKLTGATQWALPTSPAQR